MNTDSGVRNTSRQIYLWLAAHLELVLETSNSIQEVLGFDPTVRSLPVARSVSRQHDASSIDRLTESFCLLTLCSVPQGEREACGPEGDPPAGGGGHPLHGHTRR